MERFLSSISTARLLLFSVLFTLAVTVMRLVGVYWVSFTVAFGSLAGSLAAALAKWQISPKQATR